MDSNLHKARKARGLSQTELAARIGVAQGSLSKVETGAVRGSLETQLRLAHALEMPPLALFPDSPFVDVFPH